VRQAELLAAGGVPVGSGNLELLVAEVGDELERAAEGGDVISQALATFVSMLSQRIAGRRDLTSVLAAGSTFDAWSVRKASGFSVQPAW
jgi:hypothetical protein